MNSFRSTQGDLNALKKIEEKFRITSKGVTSLNILNFSLSYQQSRNQKGRLEHVPTEEAGQGTILCSSLCINDMSGISGLAKALQNVSWKQGISSHKHGSTLPERSDCNLEALYIN